MDGNLRLADIDIGYSGITAETAQFIADFKADGVSHPSFSVECMTGDILDLHRMIAERMPLFGRLAVHGAAIECKGKGYLFIAPSGTGKSTHIRLWRKAFGDEVGIINGDKPFIGLRDGQPVVWSSPWSGKERWQRNVDFPLGGICLVERSESDSAFPAKPSEYMERIFRQIYIPDDPKAAVATLSLVDSVFNKVPFFLVRCTMKDSAAIAARNAIIGDLL